MSLTVLVQGPVAVPLPLRLVVASGEPIVLAGLGLLLGEEENFEVEARCGKGDDILFSLRAFRPDVLVLDLDVAGKRRWSLLRSAGGASPRTRLVLLDGGLSKGDLRKAVRLGVRGVVPKNVLPEILAECVRSVHTGGLWVGSLAYHAVLARSDRSFEPPGSALHRPS